MGTYNKGNELRDAVRAGYSAVDAEDYALVDRITEGEVQVRLSADAATSTATADIYVGSPRRRATRPVSVGYTPAANITADATNFARVVVSALFSNGAAIGEIANIPFSPTANGGTGNMTKNVRYELANATTLAVVTGNVPANGGYLAAITKAGAGGMQLPIAVIDVRYDAEV